jgi:GDP-L-fucose synthase
VTILVTGGTGLVGSALVKQLSKNNYRYMAISSQEVNLLDRLATFEFVKKTRPSVIINSAGIVRGISANINFPSSILSKNIQIQTNLIDAAHEYNIKKFVFIGSSCVYPRNTKQPMIEESLMTGELEPTNSAFAIAKIAGLELVKSYRTEFKHQWISVILNNVYGPNDNFDQGLGHVISSLISKFTEAIQNNNKSVTLLGDGSQIRDEIT